MREVKYVHVKPLEPQGFRYEVADEGFKYAVVAGDNDVYGLFTAKDHADDFVRALWLKGYSNAHMMEVV